MEEKKKHKNLITYLLEKERRKKIVKEYKRIRDKAGLGR